MVVANQCSDLGEVLHLRPALVLWRDDVPRTNDAADDVRLEGFKGRELELNAVIFPDDPPTLCGGFVAQ